MALLKTISTNFGIDATYWNIYSISEDFKNKSIEVVMSGFATKENRNNDYQPIAWQNITLNGDEYIKDATRKAIYDKLKLTSFDDSMDI